MDPLKALRFEVPDGWVERNVSDGLREFWAKNDGSTGLLQVSVIAGKHDASDRA